MHYDTSFWSIDSKWLHFIFPNVAIHRSSSNRISFHMQVNRRNCSKDIYLDGEISFFVVSLFWWCCGVLLMTLAVNDTFRYVRKITWRHTIACVCIYCGYLSNIVSIIRYVLSRSINFCSNVIRKCSTTKRRFNRDALQRSIEQIMITSTSNHCRWIYFCWISFLDGKIWNVWRKSWQGIDNHMRLCIPKCIGVSLPEAHHELLEQRNWFDFIYFKSYFTRMSDRLLD